MEDAIVDDYKKRVLQLFATPLMDACELFLRSHTRDGDVEGVEELEQLLRDELSYRAAIVESEYVRSPGGWDIHKRG